MDSQGAVGGLLEDRGVSWEAILMILEAVGKVLGTLRTLLGFPKKRGVQIWKA